MANTLDADLVVDVASNRAITVLQNMLAPLNSFTTDFSSEIVNTRQTYRVPVASAVGAVQSNPTNFESGDTTLTEGTFTPAHLSKSFHLTNAELQSGYKLEHLMDINLRAVADKIWSVAVAPIDGTNYTISALGSSGVLAASSFDAAELKILWAEAEKFPQKNIVMLGSYYSQFLPADLNAFNPVTTRTGIYGYDLFSHVTTLSGAVSNLGGFVCSPAAIVCGSRIPEMTDAVRDKMTRSEIISLPDLGMSIQFNLWSNSASRATWASFDVSFGAGKADNTALRYWKSA